MMRFTQLFDGTPSVLELNDFFYDVMSLADLKSFFPVYTLSVVFIGNTDCFSIYVLWPRRRLCVVMNIHPFHSILFQSSQSHLIPFYFISFLFFFILFYAIKNLSIYQLSVKFGAICKVAVSGC